jgi:hypothetical protein
MTLADTPHAPALQAAIDRLYRAGLPRVPRHLVVCQCPVCMTPETRAAIVATPVRDLTEGQIAAYTNSAHGVPPDPDDLVALLPRYLDLLAQDAPLADASVAADLLRFHQARTVHPGFPPPAMAHAMHDWLMAVIPHFGALQVAQAETLYSPWILVEMTLVGGWPVADVTGALDRLFGDPAIGTAALAAFLTDVARSLRNGVPDLWALHRYRREAALPLADWLDALLQTPAAVEVLTDPAQPDAAQVWLQALMSMAGTLAAAMRRGAAD